MTEIITGPSGYFAQQQQQPDLVGNLSHLLALKQQQTLAPLQAQAAQQQVQLGGLQIQTEQQNMEARKALNEAYAGAISKNGDGTTSFDEGKLRDSLMSGPAAFKTPEVVQGLAAMKKAQIELQDSAIGLQTKQQDMLGNAAKAVQASNYNPAVAHAILDQFPPSPQTQQVRAQIDNPQMLKQWVDTQVAQSPNQQKMQNEKDVAGIRAGASPDVREMNDFIAKNPGKGPLDYQQYKANQQVENEIRKETDPRVMNARAALASREAVQKQSLSQGDPAAAAQLLVNGDATLSELKARGSTPEFISRTLFEARKLSGGKYNAQEAEANFNVAKSQANTAFFGSAKSLTDKGGTLDQLAETAKKIPQNQIPAFNSIEDWAKAAAGSGPLAEYAARVLGVADDYAKVMGGGVGSDASRLSAANLISAKLSKEGREGALAGIRGSVNSQINGRIGKNPVLQRMYGDVQSATQGGNQPSGGPVKITLPSGKTIQID
jgi:hypothetical protein